MALTKTYDGPPVAPGQAITYTLRSSNRGSVTARATILSDTVPAYTTFDANASAAGWSCPQGAPAGTSCTLALGDLALGESKETTFVVRALDPVPPGADAVVNRARLHCQQGFAVTQTLYSELQAQAELVVAKTDGVTTVRPGDALTYTITLHNTGRRGSAGIVLTDTLPIETTYLPGSASDGGRYDPARRQIVWTLDAFLPGGQDLVRTYRVLVNDPLPLQTLYLTNTVTVDDDGANGDADAGNQATDVDTVDRDPALRIVKRGPERAEVGDRIVYTLTVATVSYTPTGLGLSRIGDGSPIRDIEVSDAIAHPVHYLGGDDGDGLLELGETWVYTASYTVAAADRGTLVNTVTARGYDINGDLCTASDWHMTWVPGRTLYLPLVLGEP
jgi:uncharacterized repeat protein (TIGR01451 family)